MKLHDADDILELIRSDDWMMDVLGAVADLQLPDCWVGAGFVRSKIWDVLHGRSERTALPDVDVIFFDPVRSVADDLQLSLRLTEARPDLVWEVVNQAHVHTWNSDPPYSSGLDSVSKWPETATAVAVRLTASGELQLLAPHGVSDLVRGVLRPTPHVALNRPGVFKQRMEEKQWEKRWPMLRIMSE